MPDFLNLSKEAFEASTTYMDANYRKDFDYSLRAFRNEHAPDSKYNSPEYQARSRVFDPKTRSVIRKNEAAAAVALFSNMDIVDMTPGNPDDMMSVASTACMKEILQYRMTKTIPAFPLVMGAVQDAQVQGAVVSYNYWEFQKNKAGKIVKDRPCIQLRPIENIRIDPAADWLFPVESSPYLCDIIPMYVCDVRARMDSKDDKTGQKWKKYDDSVILKARPDVMDSTRSARNGGQQDPLEQRSAIKAFDVVWVMRWCMRDSQGEDYTYYTLGTEELLSEPLPLEEVYFHGRRPYVMGCAIIETHKTIKTSVPTLIRPLQQAINTLRNQRFDNVQFVLNKRWLVRRGSQTDVNSLVRNVPGGVTLTNNPGEDIKAENWVDVTSSSYAEDDRMRSSLDELAGNFSPGTRVANNAMNDTLGGSRMASQGAGIMSDYLLRTVIETWYEPVLRQLVLLEQYYESDSVVLGICAKNARLFPRFGLSQITDEMLMKEVNVSVNVGMGSTNPSERFQKFIIATKAAIELVTTAPPGFNVIEGVKEIYSNAGYRDGSRFISEQNDPRLMKAMQMVQQLQQALQGKGMELQAQGQIEQLKLLSSDRQKAAQLQVDTQRIQGDLAIRQSELAIEDKRVQLEALKLELEARGADQELTMRAVELQNDVDAASVKLQAEREKLAAQQQHDAMELEKSSVELDRARAEVANESRVGEVANEVLRSMGSVGSEIETIKKALADGSRYTGGEIEELRRGLGVMFNMMTAPKRKPVSIKKVKDGKATKAVVVTFDDGATEEMAFN